MNVGKIKVRFTLQKPSAAVGVPLFGEKLCRMQDRYRKWVAGKIRRVSTIPVLQKPFDCFPVVGAAKIAAQEIMKLSKTGRKPRAVMVCLLNATVLRDYQTTFEGYVRHVRKGLGKEPYSTVDIIIELPQGIVLIERSNPPYGWALPGGFVDPGEGLLEAAIREAKEETNLGLENVRRFRAYSGKRRDPRFHTLSTVFVGKGQGRPQFGDDAKGLRVVKYSNLRKLAYAFDHKKIISDYLKARRK